MEGGRGPGPVAFYSVDTVLSDAWGPTHSVFQERQLTWSSMTCAAQAAGIPVPGWVSS